MDFTVESDVGLKRAVNEDRVHVVTREDSITLAILADGMGGHNAGDVASEMAIQLMQGEFLKAETEQLTSKESRKHWLQNAVSHANYEIYDYSLKNEGCNGMGTTLIACVIDGTDSSIAHVGDSRVYLFLKDEVQLITRDHSYVNALIDKGAISEEEALNHPNKNVIVKALGTESTIQPDILHIPLEQTLYVLICSDGLSNKVSTNEMAAILVLDQSIQQKGKMLVHLANDSGGEDNISLILLTVQNGVV